MENRKLKYELKNFDMDSLELDTFGESLLLCIPRIKKICKHIDNQVHDMAVTAFIPYMTAMDQYNAIIDNMLLKSELMNLYRLCVEWYRELSDDYKKIFKAYFIKHQRKSSIDIMAQRTVCRAIDKMTRSFVEYLRTMLDGNEKELIKNPFIYKIYITRLKSKENYKYRGRWN